MKRIRQALILAGGVGARLGDLTSHTPKPLLNVQQRPFLEYLVWNLRRYGINDIVMSVGYLADSIESHFGNGSRAGVSIRYCREDQPAGTGGAVKLAAELLSDDFLVLNGDTLFDVNYLDLWSNMPATADGMIALRRSEDVSRYGRIVTDGQRITAFAEKTACGPGWINGGVYCLKRRVVEYLPNGKSSLEHDLFPNLLDRGRLYGQTCDGFFVDIGIPETLRQAERCVPEWQSRPAAFLDRDGVINVDHGHVHTPDEFEWIDGAQTAIRRLNDLGYLVIVVTNQSGIGRGLYTHKDFLRLMEWVDQELAVSGAHIDAVHYSPYHPIHGRGGYRRDSDCRKPRPGMILQAFRDWPIQRPGSFMVGDSESDRKAAESAQIAFHKFTGEDLLDFIETILHERPAPPSSSYLASARIAG